MQFTLWESHIISLFYLKKNIHINSSIEQKKLSIIKVNMQFTLWESYIQTLFYLTKQTSIITAVFYKKKKNWVLLKQLYVNMQFILRESYISYNDHTSCGKSTYRNRNIMKIGIK